MRQAYLQLGTFSIFTFFQQEVSLFGKKKNKKAKERLKTNVKSRMDNELSKRFSANEETIYYDHYSSFAPRAIFLGGGREGTGRDVLSFFRWWAIKM